MIDRCDKTTYKIESSIIVRNCIAEKIKIIWTEWKQWQLKNQSKMERQKIPMKSK